MKLVLAGLNHRSAPVEVREGLAFRPEDLSGALQTLRAGKGAREAMILCTCNRVEVTAMLDDEASTPTLLCEFLAESHGMTGDGLRSYIYTFEEQHAIRHLFRVASSLDSMVVGEPQILGQLKAAFALAREQGSIGTYLDAVLTRAFSVAKRVRTETQIGQNAVSVSHAAVELARDIFGSLNRKTVLIIGAGKMSESAAKHLQRAGATDILITNRTPERAERMATLFQGRNIPYEDFPGRLHEADIVITSSAAPGYVLNREQVKRAIDARRNQPVFLIDIAVPRNIDPATHDLEHAFVYDIDDLQRIADQNMKGRREVAEHAEGIVNEEVGRLLARLRARDVAPTIVSLQEQLESLRRNELMRFRGKLGDLTPEQEEALEGLTRGIINKIAHGPISELRRQAEIAAIQDVGATEVHNEIVNVVRRVFRLKDGGR
jgi:glutamyl-tRNA reductase